MKLYRIANWEFLFETCETKKLASLKWVPTPNKHDGLSFRKVAANEKRCELFAAWNLILQIASKARKPVDRGLLQRDGKPLSPDDMAIMTGFPAKIFELALNFFSSEQIGWLVVVNEQPPAEAGSPPDASGSNPAEGKEGKGKKEGSRQAAPDFSDIIPEGLKTPEFEAAWSEWIVDRKKRKKSVTELAAKKQLSLLEKFGPAGAVESINASIQNGWAGLFDSNGAARPPNGNSPFVKVKVIDPSEYIDPHLAAKKFGPHHES